MKKVWKIVTLIVLVAIVLGAVCVGVGVLTGADTGRIYSVLDNRYNIGLLYEAYTQYAQELVAAFQAAGF